MTRVTIDADVLAKLKSIGDVAELCDEAGRVVGLFTPMADRSLYKQVEPPVSEEELDRIEKEGGGRPLREILDDLEKKHG
jgi:hypothetical protein